MDQDELLPLRRPRRLRISPSIRDLVHETDLDLSHLVQGVFVEDGEGIVYPIPSMPGISRYSPDTLLPYLEELVSLGIRHIILFGVPRRKDPLGLEADAESGVIQRTLRLIKEKGFPLTLIADACFCEYTDHGHCGVLSGDPAVVDNDATLERLASLAVSLAEAGADIIAPSGMMDGTVRYIRSALDRNGYMNVAVLMYSVKYASSFYGPFREAAQGAPRFGDRRTYQMDFRNAREALVEALLDVEEGADMILVKPALPYLDILARLRQKIALPLAAFNVSGEYAMVKSAVERGWISEREAVTEILTSIRRAGADLIITYHARDFARWQRSGA
jgi:porphobilinogen synthase